MPYKKFLLPSINNLGLLITAESFQRGIIFDFPIFPEGKEYPIIIQLNTDSDAYKKGLRIGDKIISLNGYSMYHKDISTVKSDFDYEKRSNKTLEIMINR